MNTNTNQPEQTSTIDVVYLTSKGSGEDLRYSLRSLDENYRHVRNVYLIGQMPSFINDGETSFIPFPDDSARNVDRNIIKKLAYLSSHEALGEIFLCMSDDHYILKPTGPENQFPYPIQHEDEIVRTKRTNVWKDRLVRTKKILNEAGYTGHNYDSHLPSVLGKDWCRELLKWDYDQGGLCCFSLYFNTFLQGATPCTIPQGTLYDFRGATEQASFEECRFAVTDDKSFASAYPLLEKKFPHKSKYEL